jgi:hypothetical protein
MHLWNVVEVTKVFPRNDPSQRYEIHFVRAGYSCYAGEEDLRHEVTHL